MQSIETVVKNFQSQCLDYRDLARLADFLTEEQFNEIANRLKLILKKDYKHERVLEFTEENILKQLEADLDFAFEKALDERGISASLMQEVIIMWNTILENEITADYVDYGLPLLKLTAKHYGFKDPTQE